MSKLTVTEPSDILFELTLSIGNSLDLQQNCHSFFRALEKQMQVSYVGLWLFSEHFPGQIRNQQLCIAYQYPKRRALHRTVAVSPMPYWDYLQDQPFITLSSGDLYSFSQILKLEEVPEDESCSFIRLGDFGFLSLHAENPPALLHDHWDKLGRVFDKFTDSLASTLDYSSDIVEYESQLELSYSQRENGKRFHLLANNIDEGLFILDLQGRVTFANRRIIQMTGFNFEELYLKKPWEFLTHKSEIPRIEKTISQRLEGMASRYEVTAIRKDSTYWWAEVNGSPYRDAKGNIIGIITVVTDITQRKKAEQQQKQLVEKLEASNADLELQKEYLTGIYEFSTDLLFLDEVEAILEWVIRYTIEYYHFIDCAIYLKDKRSKTSQDFVREVFHSSPAIDGLINDLSEFWPLRCQPGESLIWQAAHQQKTVLMNDMSQLQGFEPEYHDAHAQLILPMVVNGQTIGVIALAHPWKDFFSYEHQATFSTIASLAAVKIKSALQQEKQRKTELKLKENEERIRLMIDTALDAVVLVDRKGKLQGWNQQAQKMFGYPEKEALGRNFTELIIPEYCSDGKENNFLRDIYKGRLIGRFSQHCAMRKNGEKFPVELAVTPIRQNNRTLYSAFVRDITLRKRNEEELIKARHKAEESARAKEHFLANMSHEIRTPMNAILGMTRLLNQEARDEKSQKYLNAIMASGENLLVLINDILDISKIEAGKLNIEHLSFDLVKSIETLYDSMSLRAQDNDILLLKNIDPDLPKALKGDPVRLNQVLVNLLGNAIKFTPQGSVTLNCRLLSATEQNVRLEFSVVDTGIGIDTGKLTTIFESFNQEDSSIARRFGGTGLGLAISQQLVDLMGGHLKVSSEKGKGSTFSFVVDMEVADQLDLEENISKETEPQLTGALSILLAEDNYFNQMYLQAILEAQDVALTIVDDGKEAVEQLREHSFDIVLMDIQMPQMDGVEATRYIREELKSEVPIIALTANAFKSEQEKFLAVGMNSCVIKPFETVDLFEKIIQLTEIKPDEVSESVGTDESPSKMQGQKIESLFSLTKIESLAREDDEFVKQMLVLVKGQLEEFTLKSPELWKLKDYKSIRSLAHKLKSPAKLLEINSLNPLLAQLEDYQQTSQEQDFELLLKKVLRQVEIILPEIEECIGNS